MPLRKYKVSRRIWMTASIVMFIVIGLFTRFDQKGEAYSLAMLYVANLWDLVQARGDGAGLIFLTLVLVIWVGVSMLVGWLVQCIFVMLLRRGRDD